MGRRPVTAPATYRVEYRETGDGVLRHCDVVACGPYSATSAARRALPAGVEFVFVGRADTAVEARAA